jgi:hypothetical protein
MVTLTKAAFDLAVQPRGSHQNDRAIIAKGGDARAVLLTITVTW